MDRKKVKGFIFDVDGTLYSLKKMRIRMLGLLLSYYCVRPHRLKELYALFLFRMMREKSEYKGTSFEELYLKIEKKISLPAKEIEKCIQYWMFQAPLNILPTCAYQNVIAFINKQYREGKQIIIYSDYQATEKLQAIGVEYDLVFSFGQNGVSEQKPSIDIMKMILAKSGHTSEQILYVGDRDDRDRISAGMVHIPYCDIKQFRRSVC